MMSVMLDVSAPIVGAPHCIASKTGRPNPSCLDGKQNAAHRLYKLTKSSSGTNPVTTTPVGTARLRFTSCDDATFEYHFTSGEVGVRNGTIAMKRLGATPASCRF